MVELQEIDDDANFQEIISPGNYCWAYEIKEKRNCPIPKERGLYAWYFRKFPQCIPTEGCRHYLWRGDNYTLLYIGIAPSEPPESRKTSKQMLVDRIITQHIRGNAESSTLRLSLGCLLSEELGIQLRNFSDKNNKKFVKMGERRPSEAKKWRPEGEKILTDWMCENALVVWTLHDEPWRKEVDFITRLSPPLNLECNKHHPFYAKLSAVRHQAQETAKKLEIVNEGCDTSLNTE